MAKQKSAFDQDQARQRVLKIFPILVKTYPGAKTELIHADAFQLLVATILSAQCTDDRVNLVTPELFRKYPGPKNFAQADPIQIEEAIRSTGFYRNKAKNIQGACRVLLDRFGGKVPRTMEELITLPGVGRKTANCILGNCYGQPAITCDTHVIRLSRRLELSDQSDPVKLEFDLMEVVPREKFGGWTLFSNVLIFHGRYTCKARKPDCDRCPIIEHCPCANRPDLW
ncbi:MAG: endonuclease III [Phycisphaerae bacterium]|nr:endonuclease III [Phycisphaerae bacterium]